MIMYNGKVQLTLAEIEHNKAYIAERNKLITEALAFADKHYGDHLAPLLESDMDRWHRDAKWNYTFHSKMNLLAKGITYTEEIQAC